MTSTSSGACAIDVFWLLLNHELGAGDPAGISSALLPGASRAEALRHHRDALWAVQWKYAAMEASATRSGPPPDAPPFTGSDEDLVRGRAVYAGTPDELVDALHAIRRRAGVPV